MKTADAILAATLLAPMLALGGCHHRAVSQSTVTAAPPGIVVSQARLVLPPVKGNPGAAYFTVGNESSAPARLVRVEIVGAQKTEMHQTSGGTMGPLPQVDIAPGQRVIFAPGGRHVMVFGLAPSLAIGGSSQIIFHFQDGKTTSTPLRIDAAGDGMTGMAGMNMDGKP